MIHCFLNKIQFKKYDFRHDHNSTEPTNSTIASESNDSKDTDDCNVSSFSSVSMLLTGIIASRFGLWLADLTVTQILQERVSEEHRGTIGGVQNGLNNAMNTIKFCLVIALPEHETFGWLILASYLSICTGALFYYTYFRQQNNLNSRENISILYKAAPVNESVDSINALESRCNVISK